MKKLKIIILVISTTLFNSFSMNASEIKSPTINKELRSEIITILGSKIPLKLKKESTAVISFVMNNKNELVVLSVDSKFEDVSSFIKNKLNYKRINLKGVKKGAVYTLSLKIKVTS
jgi:hypothetical protein